MPRIFLLMVMKTKEKSRTKQKPGKAQVVGFRKDRKSGKTFPILAPVAAASKGGEISCSLKFRGISPKQNDATKAVEQRLEDLIQKIKTSEFELAGLIEQKRQGEREETDVTEIVKEIESKESEIKHQKEDLKELQLELKS